MAERVVVNQGISLSSLVFLVFLVLKLCGVITWPWWIVTMPLWISFAVVLAALAAAGAIAAIVGLIWGLVVGLRSLFRRNYG